MIDISQISNSLKLSPEGVWESIQTGSISFPDQENIHQLLIEPSSFWYQHRKNFILNLVNKFPPHGTFFDIGGGGGYICRALSEQGFDVGLIEPTLEGISKARERGVKLNIRSSFQNCGFKEKVLSAVGLFDVLEHLKDDEEFLTQLFKTIQPGGNLYLSVPAYSFLWSIEDEYFGHHHRYTLKNLESLLNRTGFQVDFSTYLFHFLVPMVYLFRTLPTKLGLTTKHELSVNKKEHLINGKLSSLIVSGFCKWEINRIRSNHKIPFGTSCVVVAHRPH